MPAEWKTFDQIAEINDLWRWLEGPVVAALYDDNYQTYHEGSEMRTDSGRAIWFGAWVGRPRLRQLRTSSDSCTNRDISNLEKRWEKLHETCFEPYYYSPWGVSSDKRTFQPNNTAFPGPWWSFGGYNSSDQDLSSGYAQQFAWYLQTQTDYMYSNEGFSYIFPNNRAQALSELQALRNEHWLDLGSRMVTLEFNVHNKNVERLAVARFVVELSPGGNVKPTVKLRTVSSTPIRITNFGWLCFVVVSMFLLSDIFSTCWQLSKFNVSPWHYITQPGRIVELALYLLYMTALILTFAAKVNEYLTSV